MRASVRRKPTSSQYQRRGRTSRGRERWRSSRARRRRLPRGAGKLRKTPRVAHASVRTACNAAPEREHRYHVGSDHMPSLCDRGCKLREHPQLAHLCNAVDATSNMTFGCSSPVGCILLSFDHNFSIDLLSILHGSRPTNCVGVKTTSNVTDAHKCIPSDCHGSAESRFLHAFWHLERRCCLHTTRHAHKLNNLVHPTMLDHGKQNTHWSAHQAVYRSNKSSFLQSWRLHHHHRKSGQEADQSNPHQDKNSVPQPCQKLSHRKDIQSCHHYLDSNSLILSPLPGHSILSPLFCGTSRTHRHHCHCKYHGSNLLHMCNSNLPGWLCCVLDTLSILRAYL
mmetsp:Transcript_110459/g.191497  ORF Transcript_110459/g.191497 Transcript_110459/m.191497 type:complete len:338 (+) Transcript_110459:1671-2684(+)